eukprot:19192-Heterococcus_DN1.PRE.1
MSTSEKCQMRLIQSFEVYYMGIRRLLSKAQFDEQHKLDQATNVQHAGCCLWQLRAQPTAVMTVQIKSVFAKASQCTCNAMCAAASNSRTNLSDTSIH